MFYVFCLIYDFFHYVLYGFFPKKNTMFHFKIRNFKRKANVTLM
jgi:hypothetical protein